jgi:uncharacterized protein YecT (DUF1311 family)
MKPFITIVFMLFATCPLLSRAQQTAEESPIDVAYYKCLAKDSSASGIAGCAFKAYGEWEDEVNKYYSRLLHMARKDTSGPSVENAQAAWMTYREQEFKVYDNMFNIPGNEWVRLRSESRIDVMRQRAMELRRYYEALEQKKR